MINQLKEQIKDKNKDIEYHFERISDILGFNIEGFDINSIYSDLDLITIEEKNLNDMCAAWDSEDSCAMACNDPLNTTLIESHQINEEAVITLNGKKYIKKDEIIKNTKTINLNGFEYFELK